MQTNLTIDEAGRVTLPDAMRAELHLNPGDTLEAITSGNGVILRPAGSFHQKEGIWVLETERPSPPRKPNGSVSKFTWSAI